MPRKRNETNQQWMDRVRAARGLPPLTRENLFQNLRAAKCYVASISNPERQAEVELAAFMHFFHPRPEGYTINDTKRMLGHK